MSKQITGFVRCLEEGCGYSYMTVEPLAGMWCAVTTDKHEEETGHTRLDVTFGQLAEYMARRHGWGIE